MILGSKITEQETLISTLHEQLAQAKKQMEVMQSDDKEITDLVERLESALSKYDDCREVVANRLNPKPDVSTYHAPSLVEIEFPGVCFDEFLTDSSDPTFPGTSFYLSETPVEYMQPPVQLSVQPLVKPPASPVQLSVQPPVQLGASSFEIPEIPKPDATEGNPVPENAESDSANPDATPVDPVPEKVESESATPDATPATSTPEKVESEPATPDATPATSTPEKMESESPVTVQASDTPDDLNPHTSIADIFQPKLPEGWVVEILSLTEAKIYESQAKDSEWVLVTYNPKSNNEKFTVNHGFSFFVQAKDTDDILAEAKYYFESCVPADSPVPLTLSKRGISFAYTLPELKSGNKTVTRRTWKDNYAQQFIDKFENPETVTIYPALTKSRGGECVGYCKLTHAPYKEMLADMPGEDLAAEGFPDLSKQKFVDKFFGKNSRQKVWVIRFEFIPLDSPLLKKTLIPDSGLEDSSTAEYFESGIVDEAIATLLNCQNDKSLILARQKMGFEVAALAWEQMGLIQKNQIQFVSQRSGKKKTGLVLGDQIGVKVFNKTVVGRLIGFYLHGKPLDSPDERAVLVNGEASVYNKSKLIGMKKTFPPTEEEIVELERLLTLPKPVVGLNDGSKPNSDASSPRGGGGQLELDLDSLLSPDSKLTRCEPTPALAESILIFQEIDSTLSFFCETDHSSVHLNVYSGKDVVCSVQDNGKDIVLLNVAKFLVLSTGLSRDQRNVFIDRLRQIESVPCNSNSPQPPEIDISVCEPTPTLEKLISIIQKIDSTLTFSCETNYESVFLNIYSKQKSIGYIEDDGEEIYVWKKSLLNDHGFTMEQIASFKNVERVPFESGDF